MKSQSISPSTQIRYGLKRVCSVWGINRSSIYLRSKQKRACRARQGRGPKPLLEDDQVVLEIRRDLNESPFHGEGHRKVHARIRRKGVVVGRERVRKLMRQKGLLSPHRSPSVQSKSHDGRITTDAPNLLWATDATKIDTVEDGLVWFFGVIEHWNAECLGWRVSKRGDRFVALDALKMALNYQYGSTEKGCAQGLNLRPDHGPQFKSQSYREQMKYWGIVPSFSYVGEPETNGVVERFHRTFKEQIVYGRIYQDVEELERAVKEFIPLYNEKWLLEKLSYYSPLEARHALESSRAV